MKGWLLLAVIAMVIGKADPAHAQDPAAVDSLALARKYTVWLYTAEVDSLDANGSERYRSGEVEQPEYARLARMIAERAGFEIRVVEETWKLRNGRCQYWRVAEFANMEEPLLVRWVLDPSGRIDGVGLGPLSQAPPVESETCAPR